MAIPGDTGLQLRIVRGIQPDDATAPTKSGDTELAALCFLAHCPRRGRVEVRHDLCVVHFADDLADLVDAAQLRYSALARIEFGRDCHKPKLSEAAADVLDMLVYAENFLHDQHQRKPDPVSGMAR